MRQGSNGFSAAPIDTETDRGLLDMVFGDAGVREGDSVQDGDTSSDTCEDKEEAPPEQPGLTRRTKSIFIAQKHERPVFDPNVAMVARLVNGAEVIVEQLLGEKQRLIGNRFQSAGNKA